jgi:hypothetical protein
MAKKIKVPGYSKKTIYNRNIEYTEFSPDLVGLQLTNNGGNTLFTMGNFSVTTNLDPKVTKNYITNNFSKFYSIDELTPNDTQFQEIVKANAKTILRLDSTNLKNHALFGSMSEYFRVTLEDIITSWPASIYVNAINPSISILTNTYEDYSYDILTNLATFKVSTGALINKYDINYVQTGTLLNTYNESNKLRDLVINYLEYCVFINDTEYNLVEFIGSNDVENDYIYLTVVGDPFGNSVSQTLTYHIKPKSAATNLFFNTLDGLKKVLLNLTTIPKYTITFEYPQKSETGNLITQTKTLTWPVKDGYNLEFNSVDYENYVTDILEMVNEFDANETSLMTRFLVSESISSFDTLPVRLDELHQDTTTGQKVTKTLNIYGRSFDDINKFIKGISFAHVVTYNKKNNMPDKYLKDLARVLGWELITSVLGDDLLETFTKSEKSSYAGQSIGMTPSEVDIELWRRLILNSPWIWKAKGARKSVEFLLKFLGIPNGLITFNEYIYLADGPIDIDLFLEVLDANGLDTDPSLYPVDTDGYPKPLPNSDEMYYQNYGLWYRQTGGQMADIDILLGNNPHVGPYDGGSKYINQFRTLIPNFSTVTVSTTARVINTSNLFTNYNLGLINGYNGQTYIDIVDDAGNDLDSCYVYTAEVIPDPMPTQTVSVCGCPCEGDDDALNVCVTKAGSTTLTCDNIISKQLDAPTGIYVFELYERDAKGVPIKNDTSANYSSIFIDKECCKSIGGTSMFFESQYEEGIDSPTSLNMMTSGNICCGNNKCGCTAACKWSMREVIYDRVGDSYSRGDILQPTIVPIGSTNKFLTFKSFYGDGRLALVTPDGSHCPTYYTTSTKIKDPYTNIEGFGCKLTNAGIADLNLGLEGYMYQYIEGKIKGEIGCCEPLTLTKSLYE